MFYGTRSDLRPDDDELSIMTCFILLRAVEKEGEYEDTNTPHSMAALFCSRLPACAPSYFITIAPS